MSDFGRQCLLARRFCEAGVRFIEVNHGSWDQHKNHRRDLTENCKSDRRPIAALLDDLERAATARRNAGHLGCELVDQVTDTADARTKPAQPERFTFWLAGGGVKAGYVHGKTDQLEPAQLKARFTSATCTRRSCTCSACRGMISSSGTKVPRVSLQDWSRRRQSRDWIVRIADLWEAFWMAEYEENPEKRPPLGLPVGSVRALLTLLVVGVLSLAAWHSTPS